MKAKAKAKLSQHEVNPPHQPRTRRLRLTRDDLAALKLDMLDYSCNTLGLRPDEAAIAADIAERAYSRAVHD